ncbi:Zn-dependent hydrolase [Sphingomonas sp. DG1-23]|uniref:Zn-dependent hydrolase n=1 Tax=Sphingomonas sp. DG1-23 TaxID=3068316 RepID=UPI00273DFA8C|nr:Zn-dependent hydrolase [Sphingomonas sp. DG1-23]MDP5278777.1 Zn-dependent hydrolase [Sphingomonas sp. DG1-23]
MSRPEPTNLKINADRLWDSLMEMGKIGATPKGGVCRIALTDLDREGRDLFVRWCQDAGCDVRVDRLGNIFARRPGRDNSKPPVMTGSHLDTQPTGGKFDGCYGVMAALEVVRALNDHGYETEAPVEIAVWTNEEGFRFAPGMTASGAFSGKFSTDFALSREDADGITFEQALKDIGYDGPEPVGRPVGAFFEAHIEQGPILEREGKTIGVVTSAQGQRWYELHWTGMESHAGTTPMEGRRDALQGAAELIVEARRIGMCPDGRATVGVIESRPQSRNTIPGSVFMTLDLRHPVEAELTRMDEEMRAAAARIAAEHQLDVQIEQIWYFPPTAFDPKCVEAVRNAAVKTGMSHMDIVSGAGHDACYLARVAPTAIIFVPCRDGVSHNESEYASKEDVADGCQVLLQAVIERANAI